MTNPTQTNEEAASPQPPVVINPDDLLGKPVDNICPKCGNNGMFYNKVGDEWCAYTECDFGCEELYKKLDL